MATMVGASLTAWTSTLMARVELACFPSVTCQCTTRIAPSAVGASPVLWNVTLRSAAS